MTLLAATHRERVPAVSLNVIHQPCHQIVRVLIILLLTVLIAHVRNETAT